MARVLYTAEATVTGGRVSGHGRTHDGVLDVQLRVPKEMGGDGGGTNPEQLFAVGYAACWRGTSAWWAVAKDRETGDASIESRVSLLPTEDRRVRTRRGAPRDPATDLGSEQAAQIVAAAHQVCPYSNATRGNVDVA